MAAFGPVNVMGQEGLEPVTHSHGLGRPQAEAAVSLLFAAGARPTAADLRRLVRDGGLFSISLDPGIETGEDNGWVELLANGLTFDLSGLAPGPAEETPAFRHRFGLSADVDTAMLEAIRLVPGPHLAGGLMVFPVVRCLAWLAALLAQLPGLVAVSWHPARSLCEAAYYRNGVLRWIEGGIFPGLGLTSLATDADGALTSEGLLLFTGQELQLAPDLSHDQAEAAKLALRLLHWLSENGRLDAPLPMTGPNGEALMLLPQADQPIIKVIKSS